MKFKVGDKVRVREDLVIGNCYGKERFVDGMKEYKGQIFTIKKNYGGVYIFEKNLFNWTDEMLEKVKKKKETQEKTFREVIADIKEGEIWESRSKYIRRFTDAIQIYHKENGRSTPSMLMCNDDKFKLQRKEYTFEEAYKKAKEGAEIQSLASNIKYKKYDENTMMFKDKDMDDFAGISNDNAIFSVDEIQGKWFINN